MAFVSSWAFGFPQTPLFRGARHAHYLAAMHICALPFFLCSPLYAYLTIYMYIYTCVCVCVAIIIVPRPSGLRFVVPLTIWERSLSHDTRRRIAIEIDEGRQQRDGRRTNRH